MCVIAYGTRAAPRPEGCSIVIAGNVIPLNRQQWLQKNIARKVPDQTLIDVLTKANFDEHTVRQCMESIRGGAPLTGSAVSLPTPLCEFQKPSPGCAGKQAIPGARVVVPAAFLSPYRTEWEKVCAPFHKDDFMKIYCECGVAACEKRALARFSISRESLVVTSRHRILTYLLIRKMSPSRCVSKQLSGGYGGPQTNK